MLNILEAAPVMLIALAQTLILVALGILFGTLENTTDKEFKDSGLADSSFRSIAGRTWRLIIGLALAVGAAVFCGDLFYENTLINLLMLIVVSMIEIAYTMWVINIADRIREMVAGVCLLLATWPAFCRLALNLPDFGQMGAVMMVRIIVLICTVSYICMVIARICGKDQLELTSQSESEGEYHENEC